MSVKKKAVFFDRDGVLLQLVYDKELGIVYTPRRGSQVAVMPHITNVLKTTKRLGYKNIIISNQPDIGLNRMTRSTFKEIQRTMHARVDPQKKLIDGQYYCFHHPFAKIARFRKKNCPCRKPQPGMLLQAAKEHAVNLRKSWMVGDSVYDIVAGHKAGCKTILVANLPESSYLSLFLKQLNGIKPDYIVKSVREVVPILKDGDP